MCSVGDDNLDLENSKYMQKAEKFKLLDAKCNKCRSQPPKVLLRGKDTYCRDCFLQSTVHKFKAFLGKYRFIHPEETVLIIHRCGHPTTALLHFIRTGLDLGTPKKLKFNVKVLYIEDQWDLPLEKRKEILSNVKKQVEGLNLPLYFISFIDYLKKNEVEGNLHEDPNLINVNEDDSNIFIIYFQEKTPSVTEVNELKQIIEKKLIIATAEKLKCQHVFTPELAIDLAGLLLNNLALGRGGQLPLDIGIADDRDPNIKIIRPLRMYDKKELAYYNRFNNLEVVTVPEIKTNPYESIQSLTKSFVENLQNNFPATVTTIIKIGEKLAIDGVQNESCQLCNGPVENDSDQLSSAKSTNYSHWLSTQKMNGNTVKRLKIDLKLFKLDEDLPLCFSCKRILFTV